MLLTREHVDRRLLDIQARQEAGELPKWLAKVLKHGARAAYKAEARERRQQAEDEADSRVRGKAYKSQLISQELYEPESRE